MSSTDTKLRIGFIPLADAAALIVATDRGFAADEGLDIDLAADLQAAGPRVVLA